MSSALAEWSKTSEIEFDQIESLLIVLVPSSTAGQVRVEIVRLAENQPALKPSDPDRIGTSSLFRLVIEPHTLVIGPQAALIEIQETEGGGFLSRPLGAIRQSTDESNDFTMFFSPSFLLREANDWFVGDFQALKPALEELLSEETQAVSFTIDFDDDELFAELRFLMTWERKRRLQNTFFQLASATLASARMRLKRLSPVDPHWEQLADQLDPMIEFVSANARFGWEGEQAVINLSLPAKAAHNLLLAGELLLAEDDPAVVVGSAEPVTMIDVLKSRLNYEFSQRSFDAAFLGLAAEINVILPAAGFEIVIVGDELKRVGVTRNQELPEFSPHEKTVAQLLTLLTMKANPMKVTKPSDPKQVVVWTIGPHPDEPEKQVVLITSRSAAVAMDLPLPKYFRKK